MALKVMRPLKLNGRTYAKGEVIDGEPEGRLRTALVSGGFAHEHDPQHPSVQAAASPVKTTRKRTTRQPARKG